MKKFLICAVLIFSLCFTFLAFGCTPAKMSKLVGTYELAEKTSQHVSASTADDLIEINEIKEYLVITGEERGYRIYSDKNTPVKCEEVNIEYSYTSDNAQKITNITITTDPSEPSNGRFSLYVDKKFAKKTVLVHNTTGINSSVVTSLQYTRHTRYEKLSSDTTLKTVNSKVGKSLTPIKYELVPTNGLTVMNCQIEAYMIRYEFPYIYYFCDTDIATKTATLHYALKSDCIARVESVAVDYEIAPKLDAIGTLTVGENVFSLGKDYIPKKTAGPYIYWTLNKFHIDDLNSYCEGLLQEYISQQEYLAQQR